MHSLKSFRKNSFIIIVVTLIVLYFVLRDQFTEVVHALSTVNIGWILLAILFFLLSIFVRSYVNYKSINNKKKITLMEAFKHNTIIQFFNGITPFSIGGQPMELYMIRSHNIKTTEATNIVIQNFIFYQFALVILGAVAVLYNFIFRIFPEVTLLRNLVLIGFIFNALVAVMLIVVAVSKRFTRKCMHIVLAIGSKIKVIKDKEKMEDKLTLKLKEFHDSAKELNKRKKLLVFGVLLNIVSLICLYIVPLFVLYSLGEFNDVSVLGAITASAYIMVMGSFVPLPGGAGGVEFGYLQFFGSFIAGPILTTSLLIWRVITYYLGMIIGGIAFNFDKKGEMK